MADGAGTGTVYRLVPFAEFIDAAAPLIEAHRAEVVRYPDLQILKVDRAAYFELERRESLFCLIAERDGEMIGYSINIFEHSLHYADLKCLRNDSLYCDPSERHRRVGLKLMSMTRALARELRAPLVLWHAKQGSRLEQLLAKRADVLDVIYAERL